MIKETKNCHKCGKTIVRGNDQSSNWKKRKFCNLSCAMKGKRHALGAKRSEDFKQRVSATMKNIGHTFPVYCGEKNHSWKGGITTYERKLYLNRQSYSLRMQANGHHSDEEWYRLKKHFHYMCLCCKRKEPEIKLTRDHIVPISQGGDDNISNIQPLCSSCNSRKNIKIINFISQYDTF